nr:uncharacterized protein LOC111417277 [Onthophagus taurus]
MDQNDLTNGLDIEKFEDTYEYLAIECTRLRGLLEDLGLLNLVTDSLESNAVNKNDKLEFQAKRDMLEIKARIQLYEKMNLKLSDEVKIACREVDHSKNLLEQYSVPSKEIKVLKEKCKSYQKHVRKPEFSWLQDPRFKFDNILSDMEILQQLTYDKNCLEKELRKEYCGLTPNLIEANQQLLNVKRKYDSFINKIEHRRH